MPNGVVTAHLGAMVTAGRAHSPAAAEVEPLAPAAPAPALLVAVHLRVAAHAVRNGVIAARRGIVRSMPEGRTGADASLPEAEPLALAAPAPAVLAGSLRVVHFEEIIPAVGWIVLFPGRTRAIVAAEGVHHALAFPAPSPAFL